MWYQLILERKAIAVMSGPPCESWSAARSIQIDDCNIRPLRSRSQPLGLSGFNKSEDAQLAVGNALMRTTLKFNLAAAR
eukprot:5054113-Karenia_brevis.AAC.1